MKCVICKVGNTKIGHVVVTLTRQSSTFVFKEVPAEICDVCGEEYVSEETSKRLLQKAEESVQEGVQVDIRQYLAA